MSYQHSVVFELSDCQVENKEYYYSDLEDLLAPLDIERRSYVLNRFVREVELILQLARYTKSGRKDSVRLILKRNEYWIQSEYLLPPVWADFFSTIIDLQQSNPKEIRSYLIRRNKEANQTSFTEVSKEKESFHVFVFRSISSQYFVGRTAGSNVFLLDTEEDQPLLRVEFSAEISPNVSYSSGQGNVYTKRYVRLTTAEEQIKHLLLSDDGDHIQKQSATILAHFDENHAFQRHCLSNDKIVHRCFEHQSIQILNRVRSIHFTSDFKEEYKESLWSLTDLQKLYISNSNFEQIPDDIANLQALSYLQLAACEIHQLSPKLGELELLQELWLRENKLMSLPEELSALSALKEICLDHNPFTTFPSVLARIPNLTWIRMTDCQIESFERGLSGFESLEYISLRRNQIQQIPEELLSIPTLKRLEIAGNPLSHSDLRAFKKKRDGLNPELRVDVLDTPHFQLI